MNTNVFESGATSAPANNLVLSVMNDGDIYTDRVHCGYAMLQGAHHKTSFSELVKNEAKKQRATGSKFKALEIGEAAKLVKAQTIAHCLELMREEYNGEKIEATARRWFDKVNGNSYFSVRVIIPTISGSRWLIIPFKYGYGNQWEYETVSTLRKMGFFADKPENAFRSELNITLNDTGYGLKKNMYTSEYYI